MGRDYSAPRKTNNSLIGRARREKGLTQTQLAEMLGVTQGVVARWETGKRTPKIGTLMKIAQALDVPWLELLGYTGEDDKGR